MASTSQSWQQGSAQTERKNPVLSREFGDRFIADAAKLFEAHGTTDFSPDKLGECYQHGQPCKVYPTHGVAKGSLRCNISGISCLDWTSRGLEVGVFGKGALAFLTLMWDFCAGLYDVGVLECTRKYRHQHIQTLLGPYGFCVYPVVFSPWMIGFPCNRFRKYMVVINTKTVSWNDGAALDLNKLLGLLGRSVNMTGSVYLEDTQKAEIRAAIEKMAQDRHMPLRDGNRKRWPMSAVLPTGLKTLLSRHLESMKEKGVDTDSDVFTTIDQNPTRASWTEYIPALLQNSHVYSFKHKRLLLPQEHCKIMGLPWCKAFEELSGGKVKSLTGNAMHAGALAAVVLYTLGNIGTV